MPASEPSHVLHAIDYRSVFPFTRIFRAFRVAIQPSKLVLALMAIILIYTGGQLLDWVWPGVLAGETQIYSSNFSTLGGFGPAREAARTELNERYDAIRAGLLTDAKQANDGNAPSTFGEREMYAQLRKNRDATVEAIKAGHPNGDERKVTEGPIREQYEKAAADYNVVDMHRGRGVFAEFLDFETTQINIAALSVLSLHFVDLSGGSFSLLASIFNLTIVGPAWLISQHIGYAFIISFWGLLVWSVFGGAISRIAAVEVARDEKISIRNALRFSLAKLVSFASAPVMPLLVVVFIAVVLALVGWMTEWRFVGPVAMFIVGAGFFVAILLAILATLALIGAIGGFGLMYPTISVEGSDSFDAVSRAFSYVFSRPWRVFFYSLVAILHGALSYLFLRAVVWVTLLLANACLLLWTSPNQPGETSLRDVFQTPQYGNLHVPVAAINLTPSEAAANGMLSFWAFLFTGLLGAYLLSWYQSANTIVYYLLRQDVDATDTDEVYLEPTDEEYEDEFEDEEEPDGDPIPPQIAAIGAPAESSVQP